MIRWLAVAVFTVLAVGCADDTACEDLAQVPTEDTCECLGGRVRGDPGDGSAMCLDNEENLGRVAFGIEGGVCCRHVAR